MEREKHIKAEEGEPCGRGGGGGGVKKSPDHYFRKKRKNPRSVLS